MTSLILQAIGAISIIFLFLVLYAVAIKPMVLEATQRLMEAFHRPVRHEL